MLNAMVLGGKGFGRCLSYEGEALMNGISVLIKETSENSLIFSTTWGQSKKMAIYEQESKLSQDTKSASIFILECPALECPEINFYYL